MLTRQLGMVAPDNSWHARFILATQDLDAMSDKIQATGAEVIQEPTDQPYGVRDCAFRDPAGNHVRISQVS
jgi:predicted enzyme related to lactoylglutathione lyase